jgi:hypothetical protein
VARGVFLGSQISITGFAPQISIFVPSSNPHFSTSVTSELRHFRSTMDFGPVVKLFGINVKKAIENVVETHFSFCYLYGGDVQKS